jgi:hypothetical protein
VGDLNRACRAEREPRTDADIAVAFRRCYGTTSGNREESMDQLSLTVPRNCSHK